MSVVLAFFVGLVAWRLHGVRTPPVAAVALGCTAALAVGAGLGLMLYPLTDVPVLGFAVATGLLVGRAVPPKPLPMLIFLVALAALDSIQILFAGGGTSAVSGSSGGEPAWFYYGMFVVGLPWGRAEIGMFDLLLVAALARHGRARGLPVAAAALPGAVGLLIADAVVVATRPGNLPLLPFLLAGWLAVEAGLRLTSRRSRPSEARSLPD
jgi:hypothetical protein